MPSSSGLYLHVLFCRSKCHYCAFPSQAPAPDRDSPIWVLWLNTMLDVLEKESSDLPWGKFLTLYVGGGTPSLIPPAILDELLTRAEAFVEREAEITVEANPESLSLPWLEVLERHRVTRISLGIQSFSLLLRRGVGRNVTESQLKRSRKLLSKWKGSLGLDLIFGLPGQTERDLDFDAETALEWGADHLSLYPLSLEPGTPLQRAVDCGSVTLSDGLEWERTIRRWQSAGLIWYEVANFARPGSECRHNLGYWRQNPFLGIGAGAVTTFPLSKVNKESILCRRRTWGQDPLKFAGTRVEEALSSLDWRKEALLLGLRTQEGIDRMQWASVCDRPWEVALEKSLKGFRSWFLDGADQNRLTLLSDFRLRQDEFLRAAFVDLDVDARHQVW